MTSAAVHGPMPACACSALASAAAPAPPAPLGRDAAANASRRGVSRAIRRRSAPRRGSIPSPVSVHDGNPATTPGDGATSSPCGPGAGVPVRADEPAVVAPRLGARDSLLEHGRQERVPDRPGPTEPHAPEPPRQPSDHRVEGRIEPGVVVVEPERGRQAVQQPVRAGTPRGSENRRSLNENLDRAGALGRCGGANRRSRRDTHRRIAAPANQRPEDGAEIERPLQRDRPRLLGRRVCHAAATTM